MDDTQAPADKASKPAPTTAEAMEQMILLSHTMTQSAAASSVLAGRGLTLDGYALLLSLGAEEGSPSSKMAKRASTLTAHGKQTRADLVKAGLITDEKGAEGRRVVALTPAGTAMIATLRAEFGALPIGLDPRHLRPVSRVASLVRQLSKALSGEAEKREAKRAASGDKTAKRAERKAKRATASKAA